MQHAAPSQPQLNHDDEIDLFELFENIWNQKWLVLIVTNIALITGAAFAFLTTPTYEAKVHLLPPTSEGTVELRQQAQLAPVSQLATTSEPGNRDEAVKLKQFSTEDVYKTFVTTLQSNQAKRDFLSQPDVREYFEQFSDSPQSVWKMFNEQALAVSVPTKGSLVNVSVSFKMEDPELAAEFANRYVALAAQLTRTQLANDLRAEIKSVISAQELQIKNRKSLYISQLDIELSKLSEALHIAEQIGLDTPLKTDTIIDDTSRMMVDEVRKLYRLGSRALEAEIQAINQRRESETFIPGLMQLQQQLGLLSSMSVNEDKIVPATVDLPAEVPEKPIKPKKALILALSVVLGGMLGVMIALVRSAIRNRKAQKTAA